MKKIIKCPVCKGKGEVISPKMPESELRAEMVKILLKEGFGLREVQRMIGFKSPTAVSYIKNKLL